MSAAHGLVVLGVFGAAHGVRGEVRLKSWTAEPEAIGSYGPLTGSDGRTYEILALRPQKDMLIARIKGVTDRNAAERLVNIRLSAPRTALGESAAEDEFFHADLVGLPALTEGGETYGTIIAIHDFGAGDLLEIAPAQGGPTRYLPFTREVVPVVDVKAGRVIVQPPTEIGDDLRENEGAAPSPPRRRGRP